MKYFFILLSFFILGSCSKSESTLSITCGGDNEYRGKITYLNFDLSEGVVAVKDIPTAFGSKVNKNMQKLDSPELLYNEVEYELKIKESTPSYLKYGFSMQSSVVDVYFVLDRSSLKQTTYTTYRNVDGTLMDLGEGVNNPSIVTDSCKKPIA